MIWFFFSSLFLLFSFSFPFFSLIPFCYRIPLDPRARGPPPLQPTKHTACFMVWGLVDDVPKHRMGVCFWKREARFLFLLLLWYGTALDEYSTFPLPPETQAKSDDPNPITPYASGSTLFAVKPIMITKKKKKVRE
ncbi:hypothetical protein B9Z19DRAFT_738385 [Tuber borchii]|uniref:Uncharacterized protein n=1 Tax=Tuber borchii TaxID=42251 RepID=A0A2T6ZY01_TUBBO|nr:hypothetical protein B9Z19DRAFT_738385 [Tuber borchii]